MIKPTAVLLGAMLLAVPPVSARAQGAAAPAPGQAQAAAAATSAGLTVAWINLERIVQNSAEGKIANAKVQALTQRKSNEIGEKTKQLQASQQRLQAGGTVLNDTARAQLEKEIERLQVDIQRMQEDAQSEVQELQLQLQDEFQRKLMPVIERVVQERSVNFLFSSVEAGIVYADPDMDLTDVIIQRFDAASAAAPGASAAPAPANPPASADPPGAPAGQ